MNSSAGRTVRAPDATGVFLCRFRELFRIFQKRYSGDSDCGSGLWRAGNTLPAGIVRTQVLCRMPVNAERPDVVTAVRPEEFPAAGERGLLQSGTAFDACSQVMTGCACRAYRNQSSGSYKVFCADIPRAAHVHIRSAHVRDPRRAHCRAPSKASRVQESSRVAHGRWMMEQSFSPLQNALPEVARAHRLLLIPNAEIVRVIDHRVFRERRRLCE